MRKTLSVADMAEEVLERQARDRACRTGEPLEEAFEGVLATEAGRQLEELRDGPHRGESAQDWQKNLHRERVEERDRAQGQAE